MKNSQTTSSTPTTETGLNTIVRFWACFAVCLVALALISGLMLTGFFLLMGYHVF